MTTFHPEKTMKLMSLQQRTGYPLLQENGQRRFGPPPDWDAPPPRKGCEVFVGNLPRDVLEDELVPLFANIGKIYEMRLMMDFSGSNRGFCFIQYTCPKDAMKAVLHLNNYEVRPGRSLWVSKSVDNTRLFIGGLPKDLTKEEVEDRLRMHLEDIEFIILYSDIAEKNKNRGFAFVEFKSHRGAAMARRKLIPNRKMIFGKPLRVDWALPEMDVDEEIMSKVKTIYIRNLLLSTKEKTIREAMAQVTESCCITRVKKLKDFAFVHFTDRTYAEKAMKYWDGKNLDGSRVEVMWAKPTVSFFQQSKLQASPYFDKHLPREIEERPQCSQTVSKAAYFSAPVIHEILPKYCLQSPGVNFPSYGGDGLQFVFNINNQ